MDRKMPFMDGHYLPPGVDGMWPPKHFAISVALSIIVIAAGTIGYELMCALARRVPVSVESSRAERRAAPEPARIPKAAKGPVAGPGDRPTYPEDEGLS